MCSLTEEYGQSPVFLAAVEGQVEALEARSLDVDQSYQFGGAQGGAAIV